MRLFVPSDRLTDSGAVSVRCVDHQHIDPSLGEQGDARHRSHPQRRPPKGCLAHQAAPGSVALGDIGERNEAIPLDSSVTEASRWCRCNGERHCSSVTFSRTVTVGGHQRFDRLVHIVDEADVAPGLQTDEGLTIDHRHP